MHCRGSMIEDVVKGRDTMKEYVFAIIDKAKGEMPEGEHHRRVFLCDLTKGVRRLFGAVRQLEG